MMLRRTAVFLLMFGLVSLPALGQRAQERIDADMNTRIRTEADRNSRIMHTIHYLSDVYSPRMTGTPNLTAAENWTKTELDKYGLENVHFENWDFGFPGWANEGLSVHAVEPFKAPLVADAMAWTPGTKGAVTAETYNLIPPDNPTTGELVAYLTSVSKAIRGKIVLTGRHTITPVNFTPSELRMSDAETQKTFAPERPRPVPSPTPTPLVKRLTPIEVSDQLDRFLIEN